MYGEEFDYSAMSESVYALIMLPLKNPATSIQIHHVRFKPLYQHYYIYTHWK